MKIKYVKYFATLMRYPYQPALLFSLWLASQIEDILQLSKVLCCENRIEAFIRKESAYQDFLPCSKFMSLEA